jgi:carbonic anhydrase
MTIIDNVLKANREYSKRHDPKLAQRPAPKIAIVTCMDPRLSNLVEILGLPRADMDVIRTGGPAVTEDVLGELVVSTRVLGSTEILLLNHTGCGFTTFTDAELNAKLTASTGDASPAPMRFFSYKDPEQHTREQIAKVRAHPWIAKERSRGGAGASSSEVARPPQKEMPTCRAMPWPSPSRCSGLDREPAAARPRRRSRISVPGSCPATASIRCPPTCK